MDKALERAGHILVLVILVLLVVRLTGCASGPFAPTPREELVAKIAVQYAALKVIDGKPERAARVIQVVDAIEAGSNVPLTPQTLAAAAKQAVPWSKLDQGDRLLVSSLIDLAAAEVAARVPPGEVNVPIGELTAVLSWIREAAAIAAPEPKSA